MTRLRLVHLIKCRGEPQAGAHGNSAIHTERSQKITCSDGMPQVPAPYQNRRTPNLSFASAPGTPLTADGV